MPRRPSRLALCLLPLATPLSAQEPAPTEVQPYEEVVQLPPEQTPLPAMKKGETAVELAPVIVTGGKLGRTVTETAASVGVLTGKELDRASEPAMHELVSQFANVSSAQSDRQIAIRGVLQNGFAGEGDTISVYLDGVPLPSRAANFGGPLSGFDLQQLEVLRGPQSTTQGRNSLAGAVVLRTRDPEPYWDARLRLAIASPDGHQRAFAGGGPLWGEALSFRVAVEDRYEQGDVHNLTRDEDDAAREDRRSGRLKLLFQPEEGGYRALLSAHRAHNEFGDNIHDASRGDRTATANERYVERYRADVHGLEQTLPLGGDFSLTAVSGYTEGRDDRIADYDRTEREGGVSSFQVDDDQFSQELRLNYAGERLRALLGGFYGHDDRFEYTTGRDITVAGGAMLMSGFVRVDSEVENQALFGEADWDLTKAFRLTTGLRYDREHARRHAVSDVQFDARVPLDRLGLPGGSLLPTLPLPDALVDAVQPLAPDQVPPDYDERGDQRFEVWLPKLGLTWFAGAQQALSLTYQEGYRSGGTSVSFFGGRRSDYDPEYTKTLELAARSRWLNDRLSLNLNVFTTRWRDQQVQVGVERSFDTVTVNAGRSRLHGAEAETVWRFQGPLEAFVSLGWLDTKFEEFRNGDQDYSGNEFPYAPHHSDSVGLTLTRWHQLEGQVSAQRVGSYFGTPGNSDDSRVPAKTLLHARLAWWLQRDLQLFAYGRNLTDELNLQDRYTVDDRSAHRYGEPRTLGLGVEWRL